MPETIEAQAEACWRNIIAILADAGMGVEDLVKITTYLVRPEDVVAAGAARAKHFGDARPGSATIIVKALVNPALLIEIEAVAAGAAGPTLICFTAPGGTPARVEAHQTGAGISPAHEAAVSGWRQASALLCAASR